jgi:two-component system nitrate/nitrite response regulator NarL
MTANEALLDVEDELAPITVAVALGPGTARRAVLDALATEADIDVVADVGAGDTLLGSIRELVPDVVLLSMQLSDCEPIAVCDRVADLLPVCRVALVFHGAVVSPAAIVAGAAGAVSASDLEAEPGAVVRRLARGEGFVPESWAVWMLDEYQARADEARRHRGVAPTLTATEREVLQRLANGNAPSAIAAMHEVPTRQVQLHAGYAMAKLRQSAENRRTRPDSG